MREKIGCIRGKGTPATFGYATLKAITKGTSNTVNSAKLKYNDCTVNTLGTTTKIFWSLKTFIKSTKIPLTLPLIVSNQLVAD